MENTDNNRLINGYLDGTLTDADMAEFARLIETDDQFARQATFLIRQKTLINADKPAKIDITGEIIETLAAKKQSLITSTGIRFFLNAAAIILMAVILGGAIWLAVKPAAPTSSGIEMVFMVPRQLPTTEKIAAIESYQLKFTATNVAKAEKMFAQVLYENGLLKHAQVTAGDNNATYQIECDATEFAEIASQLSPLWVYIERADLAFADLSHGINFELDQIQPDQLTAVLNKSGSAEKLKIAKAQAIINSLPQSPATDDYSHSQMATSLLAMRPVLASTPQTKQTSEKSGQIITLRVDFVAAK